MVTWSVRGLVNVAISQSFVITEIPQLYAVQLKYYAVCTICLVLYDGLGTTVDSLEYIYYIISSATRIGSLAFFVNPGIFTLAALVM